MTIVACTPFDDSAIWDKFAEHEQRLKDLEKQCEAINEDILKIQSLISALEKQDKITSINVTKDPQGNVLNYIINFSSGETITINNGKDGKDGKDGEAPVIGVYEIDGNYYWCINGEPMLDDAGNPIKANGTDGMDGANGITPQLKIEDGQWYVSYDNGATWTQIANSGDNNSGIITEVTVTDNDVIFTLADGSTIRVPKSEDLPVDPEKVYQDKEDFQNIALEMREEFNASDFENIMELAEYIGKEYADYDTEKVENWWENCWDELWKEIESSESYEIYETLYKLSAFTGKWTANEKSQSWERANADNLSVHVKDQNGNPCEITLSTSGDKKRIYLFEDEHYEYHDEYGYDENGDWYYDYWETLTEIERVYVEVPEIINIVLNQNGSKLAEVIINTDLSSMVGEKFNLAEDRYNVTASVYFNGYEMNLENLYYENNKESKINFNFKHNSKTLLTANLTATPDMAITDFEEDFDMEDINSKNNIAYINILDKLELKGECANLLNLIKVIDDEWDENTASKINRYLKMKVYFYGATEPTATIKFETEEDEWYGSRYDEETGNWVEGYWYDYDLIPIMEFYDYSRYSLEEFFNEDDFKKTIDAFESLFNQFDDLLRGYDFDF